MMLKMPKKAPHHRKISHFYLLPNEIGFMLIFTASANINRNIQTQAANATCVGCVCTLHTAPQYFSVTKHVHLPFIMTSKSIPVVVFRNIHCSQFDFPPFFTVSVKCIGIHRNQHTFNIRAVCSYRIRLVCISIQNIGITCIGRLIFSQKSIQKKTDEEKYTKFSIEIIYFDAKLKHYTQQNAIKFIMHPDTHCTGDMKICLCLLSHKRWNAFKFRLVNFSLEQENSPKVK